MIGVTDLTQTGVGGVSLLLAGLVAGVILVWVVRPFLARPFVARPFVASRRRGTAQTADIPQAPPVDGPSGILADTSAERFDDAFFSHIVAESTYDGLLVQTLDGKVMWTNEAYCRMLGLPRSRIIGRNPLEYCMPDALRPSDAEIRRFRYDPDDPDTGKLAMCQNQRANGEIFWNEIGATFHSAVSGQRFAVLICRDATEQMRRQTEIEQARSSLEHVAAHDGLTDLPNRRTLMAFADGALRRHRRGDAALGLLRVDLDRFKSINDTHGHAAGDAVLVEVAARMTGAIRGGDMAARIGGDEFVVACPGVASVADLDIIANTISTAVEGRFVWDGRDVSIGASIGAVLSDDDAAGTDELLVRSDFALYAVKEAGRGGVAVFDTAMHRKYIDQQHLASRLTRAVADGSLTYLYQPIAGLSRSRTIGIDVSVAWSDPVLGEVPATVFMPLAARLGLLSRIGYGAMEAAIACKCLINGFGHKTTRVAFTASPELITCGDFKQRLIDAIGRAGLHRQDLPVQVTETVIVGPGATEAAAVFNGLGAAGIKTVMDNFGTGYAGLASLAGLDIGGVKIHRTMIDDIVTDANSARIVKTMIDLCISLDIFVIVKGVETEAQVACLRDMGAYVMQGSIFAQPMSLDALAEWLQTHDGPMHHPVLARFGGAGRHSGSPDPLPDRAGEPGPLRSVG